MKQEAFEDIKERPEENPSINFDYLKKSVFGFFFQCGRMYFLYSEFWALINHLQNKYAIIWCVSRKKLAGRNSFHGSTEFCTSCEEGD